MRNFQGNIFIRTRTYREISKSAIVYLQVNKRNSQGFKHIRQNREHARNQEFFRAGDFSRA